MSVSNLSLIHHSSVCFVLSASILKKSHRKKSLEQVSHMKSRAKMKNKTKSYVKKILRNLSKILRDVL